MRKARLITSMSEGTRVIPIPRISTTEEYDNSIDKATYWFKAIRHYYPSWFTTSYYKETTRQLYLIYPTRWSYDTSYYFEPLKTNPNWYGYIVDVSQTKEINIHTSTYFKLVALTLQLRTRTLPPELFEEVMQARRSL